jgi:hypothetical protein
LDETLVPKIENMRPRTAAIVFFGALVSSATLVGVLVAYDRSGNPDPPLIGVDHWHAKYDYVVCDEARPNAPFWETGINTEGDGIIHINPFTAAEAGRGARLVKWFEYGGGVLTDDEVRLPGDDMTHESGDQCRDGSGGLVQVFVTPAATGVEEELEDWGDYIPQDGDLVVIYFGRDLNP